MLGFALFRSSDQLVVPRFLGVRTVIPDISTWCLPLLECPLPLHVRGRSALKVEVAGKWQRKTLVKSPLIKVERFLERSQITRDSGSAREHGAGFDVVGWAEERRLAGGGCAAEVERGLCRCRCCCFRGITSSEEGILTASADCGVECRWPWMLSAHHRTLR